MNYDHLFIEKPLPAYFRKIAIAFGVLAIITGLYLKLSGFEELFGLAKSHLKFFLLAALVLMIFSKNKVEDERFSIIQLQIFKLGFRLLIGIIILMELNVTLSNTIAVYKIFYNFAVAIIGLLVLFVEISKNGNYADAIENHKPLYIFVILFAMISIVLFNMWLWSI